MKTLLIILLTLITARGVFTQTETYDVVSYTPLLGWKAEEQSSARVYRKIDGGSWAQIGIYKSTASKGSIEADFDSEWKNLVATPFKLHEKPDKTQPKKAEGWTVMSGSGVWQFNGSNVATILTTYSGHGICVSILHNATARPYLKDYKKFIGTVTLKAPNQALQMAIEPSSVSQLPGMWIDYIHEQNGTFPDGKPRYTSGYFRREYRFFEDGKYQYLRKDFKVTNKHIFFTYETGKWSASSNQLTLTPLQSKSETWSKSPGGHAKEWGTLQKRESRKPETVTYNFEIKETDGTLSLRLYRNKTTERETWETKGHNQLNAWSYYSRPMDKSLIDLPPGHQ